jgi:uncharacterized protein YtpQ (UPF0354 family)
MLPGRAAFSQSGGMRAFRDQVLDIMRRKFPDEAVRPGPDDGSILLESSTLNLDNIYARVQQLRGADREAAIVEFLGSTLEGSRNKSKSIPWTDAKEVLRARLVPANYLPLEAEALSRPFASGVIVAYAIDEGRVVRFASESDRERWKVDLGVIHETAIANLDALSAAVELEIAEARGGGRFAIVDTDDGYDAARLVLPRFRARLLDALGEPMFVGIANRDFLVAWSAKTALFAKFVARVVEDFSQQPYPITDTIFRVDRQGVRPATANERRGR